MLNILKNTINRVFASGVDSDASAFITATGLSGTTQKSAITTLVKDLKSSGLWSKMKAVYPMVTDNRNLLSYTEDFSNAAWAKNNSTITTNTTTDPFGGSNADTLFDNGSNAAHYVSTLATGFGQNGNNTSSIYAKANTLGYLWMYFYNGSEPAGVSAWFNLSNGTVGTVQSGLTATIQDAGNGWYRCSISRNFNFTAANSNCGYGITSGDNVTSYVGTGKSIYIYGAQLELGASLSKYQPIATTPSAFMASQMKYNLKDARDLDAAFRLTWSGGWTYSATGATPNGTNAYADTKLVPNTSLSTSSAHFSKYNRTNDLVGNKVDGSIGGTSTYFMQQNYSAGNAILGDVASIMSYTPTDTRGLFTATRTSVSLGKVFRNSAQVSSATSTIGGMSDRAMYLGARNDATVTFYNTYQIAFSSIGDGLTDQDTLLLNQIVEKYQVALSRGVQAAQSFYYNSSYSNEANTYLYSTQITGTTQVSAINTLINGLKANNLWSKMKAVYPFVTDKTLQSDMAAQMKFNLVNPQDSDAAFRLAFSGGWTYSTNGAITNLINSYADTKLNPGTVFGSGYAAFGAYWRNNFSTAQTNIIGSTDTTNRFDLGYDLGVTTPFVATGNTFSTTGTDTSSKGLVVATRQNATSNKLFRNNNLIINGTLSFSANPSYNFYLGGRNNAGVAQLFNNNQEYAFAFLSTFLSDAEVAILTQLVTDYQTTLSRQV